MEREIGFYWAKHNGVWKVIYWAENVWRIEHYFYLDTDFDQIDERRIINPNE